MSERKIIEGQLSKKVAEIQALEEKLKSARVYARALEDILKELDKSTSATPASAESDVSLRRGSSVDQARAVILERGTPIYIDDLLEALGKEVTRETKASLTGSLAAYVRREEIFTRPAPSTFGLIELRHFEIAEESNEPPAAFGSMQAEDDEIPF
jgi:hypothetical protein